MAKVLKAASVLKPNGEKEIIYDSSSLLAERVTAVENTLSVARYVIEDVFQSTNNNTVGQRYRLWSDGWMELFINFAGTGVVPITGATRTVTFIRPFATGSVPFYTSAAVGAPETFTTPDAVQNWGTVLEIAATVGRIDNTKMVTGDAFHKHIYVTGYA